MCKAGRASRTWWHNSISNLLAKAIESSGYKIGYEHNGGLTDNRRPGDIIVYNWSGNRHLLIDVRFTNSLATHNVNALLQSGPGGGTETTERTKTTNYRDIDASKYIYYPFVLETCGAFRKQALQFCAKLRKIWLTKSCAGNYSPNVSQLQASNYAPERVDPLLPPCIHQHPCAIP